MAENVDPTQGPTGPTGATAAEPVPEQTPEQTPDQTFEQTAVTHEPVPAVAERQRFTDRVWNFRAMVAVALAALLLGGGIGSAIAAVAHDDESGRPGLMRFRDGPPGFGPGPGMNGPERRQFRKDLRDQRDDLRKKLREQLRELEENAPEAPTPSPS